LSGPRDSQRGRVYAWENRIIAPHDRTFVAFARAQSMVDAIWTEIGLKYPPAVEPLPRQSSATLASATRLSISLPAKTPSWCLLHELAHAMTSDVDANSDGHGPIFMGVYLKLIARYLRLDPDRLLELAAVAGIAVTSDANPIFVDAVCRPGNAHGQTSSGRIKTAYEMQQV
jgi:hypothetical protein